MVSFNTHGSSTLHRLGNGTKYLFCQLFVAAFKHRRAYLNLSNKALEVICSSHLRGGGDGGGLGLFTSERQSYCISSKSVKEILITAPDIFHLFFDSGILKWTTAISLNSLGIISKL